MPSRRQSPAAARLNMALTGLRDFLTEPTCRQCEVLEICLKRLLDDASGFRSARLSSLLRSLRQAVPFSYVHRPLPCKRCLPAEIFATYLTPEEESSVI